MKATIKQWLVRGVNTRPTRQQLGIAAAILVGTSVIIQVLYPSDRLLPFAQVDKLAVGSWQKKDTIWRLNQAYKQQTISLFFGSNQKPQRTIRAADIGLVSDNNSRVENLTYPWYIRLIPTSFLWYGALYPTSSPHYQRSSVTVDRFISSQLDNCDIKPVNASLKAHDAKLVLIPASNGGICNVQTVKQSLQTLTPHLTTPPSVRLAMKEIAPQVSDDQAAELAATVNQQLGKGLTIDTERGVVRPAANLVATWLDFPLSEGKINVSVNPQRSATYLQKEVGPKVLIPAGVSKVTTHDFIETARRNGSPGRALNVVATGVQIAQYLQAKVGSITAATQPVAPRVEYTRSYSPTDTGLSALIEHYAKDHPGTFGVQLVELSGQRRRAGYNESRQFVTASTYKLFVAYGTLKKIEAGEWQWTNQVAGGRDMAACFDDMIVKSDNACAEALLKRYGYNALTKDIRALGLSSASGFIGDSPKSTAGDLAIFMASLETRQLPLRSASRDRLIGALKRTIHRQGIPAGASGVVADKVGFLDGLLHDAAIVYSPSGTYVLTIMTDGSSWATIADLTRKIESLREQ